MTFLNPLVLLGLAAAAIPVLIHLLNRRKLRTVDFSSLRFLRELQQTSLRRLKFRQILLLLMRTLLIVALVMAFARPVLRGSLGELVGSRAGSAMALIVDDSPSMTVRNDRGLLFDQARATASLVLDQGNADDRVALLPLSAAVRPDLAGYLTDPPTARTALPAMSPSEQSVPFSPALRNAIRLVEASEQANREVFLITDAQASGFDLKREIPDTGTIGAGIVRLYVVAVPPGGQANAGILSVDLESRILSVARPADLEATIYNAGPSPLQGAVVNVFLDGTRVGQHSLDLPARAKSVLSVPVIPTRRGILQGYLQLEDDELETDNTRHFVLSINPRLRVGLTAGSADESRYLVAALTLSGDTVLAGGLSVDRLEPGRLATSDLESYDLLVLAGLQSYTQLQAERIAAFVRAGHGLMIFPGPSTDIPNQNATLLRALGIAGFSDRRGLTLPVGNPDTLQSFQSFGRIDFAHPMFSGIFDLPAGRSARSPVVESPRIWKSLGIRRGASGSAIIELGNGDPFLAEFPSGEGRVLAFAVDASLSWSDFPVRGIFAPLLHRSILYLSTGRPAAKSFIVGERLTLTTKRASGRADSRYVVRSPAGLDERVTGKYRANTGTMLFETEPALESGIYTLGVPGASGGGLQSLDAVAVGIDPRETDLRPADLDSLDVFWKTLGLSREQVVYTVAGDGIDRVIQQSRFGIELWSACVLLAVLLIAAEMALAGPWRRPSAKTEAERTSA